MAISGSRSESIVTVAPSGTETGLIWWMNNGTTSLESNDNVGAGNSSSSVYGVALAADGDRTDARKPSLAINSRAVAT